MIATLPQIAYIIKLNCISNRCEKFKTVQLVRYYRNWCQKKILTTYESRMTKRICGYEVLMRMRSFSLLNLVRPFTLYHMKSLGYEEVSHGQRRLVSDCAKAQSSLNYSCPHMTYYDHKNQRLYTDNEPVLVNRVI